MISVDGERDTPERMARYLKQQDESFIGLSGDPVKTSALAVGHGVHVELRPGRAGAITRRIPHPSYSMLLDRQGHWIISFPTGLSSEEIVAEIRKVFTWSGP